MSVESVSSIQKVDSIDSIVACQQDARDFFDSIDPKRTSTYAAPRAAGRAWRMAASVCRPTLVRT
jgi:hypothetical protein